MTTVVTVAILVVLAAVGLLFLILGLAAAAGRSRRAEERWLSDRDAILDAVFRPDPDD